MKNLRWFFAALLIVSIAATGVSSAQTVTKTKTTTNKSGMKKKHKDAIIGGVAGAAVGSLTGHTRSGAVVGAAGGYAVGAHKDKKNGTVTTKKKIVKP